MQKLKRSLNVSSKISALLHVDQASGQHSRRENGMSRRTSVGVDALLRCSSRRKRDDWMNEERKPESASLGCVSAHAARKAIKDKRLRRLARHQLRCRNAFTHISCWRQGGFCINRAGRMWLTTTSGSLGWNPKGHQVTPISLPRSSSSCGIRPGASGWWEQIP